MQTQAFEISPAIFARSNLRAARRATPRALHLAIVTVVAVAALALLGCAVAPDQMMVLGPPTPAFIAGFGVGVTMILIGIRQRRLAAAYNKSAFRAGLWQASISDAGLVMQGAHVETLFHWGAVTAVHQIREGLQIMMGEVGHVPIPAAAFADTAAQEAFQQAVKARLGKNGDTE